MTDYERVGWLGGIFGSVLLFPCLSVVFIGLIVLSGRQVYQPGCERSWTMINESDQAIRETLDYLASLQKPESGENETLVPAGERPCPICKQKMGIEVAHGISFDVCGNHGIWLDRGEMESLIARIRSGERISRSLAVREARRRGEREGKKIAGPFMNLLLMISED
jgi:Zn-finger nucleic acid-binding protein